MKIVTSVFRAVVIAATIFSASISYSFWDDNQVSDCASVTPKGGIKLPSTKVGSSSKGELVVKNTSANKIVISAVDRDGGGTYEDFSVDTSALPLTLMPGESHSFTCGYAPTLPVPWTSGTFAIFVFRFEGSDLDTSVCHYINFVLSGDTLSTQSTVAPNYAHLAGLKIFPLPATDRLILSLEHGLMQQVEIFDELGKTIAGMNNTQKEWSWDLKSNGTKVAPGVYYVRTLIAVEGQGNVVSTKKILVE